MKFNPIFLTRQMSYFFHVSISYEFECCKLVNLGVMLYQLFDNIAREKKNICVFVSIAIKKNCLFNFFFTDKRVSPVIFPLLMRCDLFVFSIDFKG